MGAQPEPRRLPILSPYPPVALPLEQLDRMLGTVLDDRKAENIVHIDLIGKSDFADRMIICSGTSSRHVSSLADNVVDALKGAGFEPIPVEGKEGGEWVLVDAGNIIVHIFRPDVREHYNLEKMWSVTIPAPATKPEHALV